LPNLETTRWFRLYLLSWCIGCVVCAIVQIAFQESAALGSNWGLTPGWQREIGFWNIGLTAILLPVAISGTLSQATAATRALVLLSFLFGVNHAVEIARGGHVISHMKAFAANLLAFVFGVGLLVGARLKKLSIGSANS
jgi:hypothetical protein